MLSTSLNKVGSTGNKPFTFPGLKPSNYTVGYGGISQTPQSKALSSAQSGTVTGSLKPGGMSTPPPSTPVKKQTTNNVDGSSTTTEYHTPVSGVLNNTKPTPSTTAPTQYGESFTDTSGNAGIAKFNSRTGQALPDPSLPKNQGSSSDRPTYAGYINQGATASNNAATTGATNAATANTGLLNIAKNGSPEVQRYTQDIANIEKQNANTQASIAYDPGIPQNITDARSAIATNLNTGRLNAAQSGLTNALSGQSQQITAGGNVLSGGLTSQGQGINGLNSAAGLAAPQAYGLTSQPYNPLTDSYGGGGANGALDRAKLAGQIDATSATASSQGQQIQSYTSAFQQGQNLQSQLTDLITTFGLNPSDVNAVNSGLQKIAQNTSSPQYKILSNYINDIANTYAQILTPSGGSQTDTTRSIAASMLDSTASGQSILQVMKSLDAAAQAKIAGVSTQGGSTSTSGSTGGGLYDF